MTNLDTSKQGSWNFAPVGQGPHRLSKDPETEMRCERCGCPFKKGDVITGYHPTFLCKVCSAKAAGAVIRKAQEEIEKIRKSIDNVRKERALANMGLVPEVDPDRLIPTPLPMGTYIAKANTYSLGKPTISKLGPMTQQNYWFKKLFGKEEKK